jgi:hypothetical protein
VNLLSTAKQVLATVAPLIGTAIGGPFGAIAGGLLAKALGTTPGDVDATSTALLSATPEQLLAIKQAEETFTEQMTQLGITKDKLAYDDIADARKMAIETKDTTPRNLAYLVLGGTGVAIAATLAGITHVESALAGTLIGYLISECKSIMQYYFGASASNAAQAATISEIAKS